MLLNHARKTPGEWPDDAQPSYCPECGGKLIAKRGDIVIWHWSHQPRDHSHQGCSHEETRWHLAWKEVYRRLSGWEIECPVKLHQVILTKAFFLSTTLVTQEQWKAIMGSNPSRFQREKRLPVECVSWDDCQAFCNALGKTKREKYRFPTEAEWEYACRAGTTTHFFFADTISSEEANYGTEAVFGKGRIGLYRARTTPVDTFPPNAFGLHDMHGNVFEWCQDWLEEYPKAEVVDPQGPATGDHRVLRGGSWHSHPVYCRSACRIGDGNQRMPSYGFRVCFSWGN